MKEEKKESPIGVLWGWGKPYHGKFIGSIILAVLGVACQMVPYFCVAHIVTLMLSGEQDFSSYMTACIVALCGYLGKVVFANLSTVISHTATYYTLRDLRENITAKLARVPMGTILDTPSGQYKTTIVDRVEGMEPTFAHLIPEMTANVLVPIVIVVYLLILDWRMALLSLVTLVVGLVVMSAGMKNYPVKWEGAVKAGKQMTDAIVEYIGGIEVVKAFSQSAGSYKKYSDAVNYNANYYVDWMRENQKTMSAYNAILPSVLICVLPCGFSFWLSGSLERSTFLSIVIFSLGLVGPIIAAFTFTDDLAVLGTNVEEISQLLNAEELNHKETPIKLEDTGISLRSVSFSYDGTTEVLHDVNLTIHPGTMTALVGPSGSGKSTVAKLIAGYWDVTSGSITLGGHELKDIPLSKIADQISYVSQDNYLFNRSIRENIRMGRPGATDAEVEQAAKQSGCDAFIRKLDNGYDTVVGSAGSHLSGGERQRIAIARAIVNEPKLLLLDEPLGALDLKLRQDMQYELIRLKNELGITFLYVTHDQEEALMMSDKIVVMSKGQIQQVGTPEEIYNKPQNAFVADFIGESNIFDGVKKEGNLIHFAHHDFVCHDDHEPGTRLDVVIRPEDVVLTTPDKGKFTGEVISCLFCGKFYEVAVLSDKNEIEAHILHELTPGTKVGVDFTADTIHTMPKDLKVNHYIGTIDKDGWLELTDGRIPVKEKEPKAHPEGTRLKMYFPSKLAKLSDDPEEGYFQGNIISIIYKGDHYNYRVLSENKVEYSVDDEDLWNIGDFVSVVVPEDAMVFESVSEDAE